MAILVGPKGRSVVLVVLVSLLPLVTAGASFGAPQGDSITSQLPVKAGWNLLSLPVEIEGARCADLFPTAGSGAIVFDTSYRPRESLSAGLGFWIKFDAPDTIAVRGVANRGETIAIHKGWNMIGGLVTPVLAHRARTSPPGILIPNFFGFVADSGYRRSDTLRPGYGYWVKATQAGTMSVGMIPCPGVPPVEYGGRTYHTSQVGEQCWLRENLDVGRMVPSWVNASDNDTIEKYCYDNDPANCATGGGLYQWSEAMQYSTLRGARGICPGGWHLPTYAELTALRSAVGGDGGALKAFGQGTGDGAGLNESGFSALLAGYRYFSDGSSTGLGSYATFWSSDQYAAPSMIFLYLKGSSGGVYLSEESKYFGFSVRCIRD